MLKRFLNILKQKPRSNKSLRELLDALLDKGYADASLVEMNRFDMLSHLKNKEQEYSEKRMEILKKNVQIETVLERLSSSEKKTYTEKEIRELLDIIMQDY
ncbi:hypothetical protein UJ101_01209 [Flavobacteriaceae bacterium UJ101]|nr:hypothetical protein UJ101_01209 [Flavobacteriaceae bacterium UJ101]